MRASIDRLALISVHFDIVPITGLVELHGGAIGVESGGEGQGSTFYFDLPLIGRRKPSLLATTTISQNGSQSPLDSLEAGGGGGWTAVTRTGAKVFPEGSESPSHGPGSASLDRSLSWQLLNLSCYSKELEPAAVSKVEDDEDEVASCYVTIEPSISDTADASFNLSNLSIMPPRDLRVLVVDDSVSNRKVLNKLLTRLGYEVEEAADGLAFLELVGVIPAASSSSTSSAAASASTAAYKLIQFEFVMIDDNMPRMCGPEAVSIARAAGYRGLIFGLTGNTSSEQLEDFKQKGTDFVFTKPLDVAKLSKMLELNSLFRIR